MVHYDKTLFRYDESCCSRFDKLDRKHILGVVIVHVEDDLIDFLW